MKKPPSINKIMNTPEISEFIPLVGKGLITQIVRDIVEKYRTGKIEDDPIKKTKEFLIDLTNPDKLINATGNPLDIRFQNLYKIPLTSNVNEPLSSTNDYLSPLILQNLYDYHLRIYPSLSISISHLLNSIAVKKIVISTQNSVDFGDIDFPDFLIHYNIQISEVGTTNRVHLKDYENAIENGVDAIVIPLTPRFEIAGFENHPEIDEIVKISRGKAKVIIILDNTLLLNISPNTIPYEFSAEKYLNCGCDIVFAR
jgi:hypothetical protein